MAEEKILIPAYKRAGSCERCKADVYAPAVKESAGWPLMSACACEQGPALSARPAGAEDSRRRREVKPEERARAA